MIQAAIHLVIYAIIIAIIVWLLLYLIPAVPLPEPVNRMAEMLFMLVGVLTVIWLLLRFAGVVSPGSLGHLLTMDVRP